ncbi:MAG: hypothetical protein GX288_08645 [Clostridiales bacterium]|nr:hypothetical protein [Clostridiales bacterium]
MINPAKLIKLKGAWDRFAINHPKFIMFLNAVKKDVRQEGTIIEITVTTASGRSVSSNLKITDSDVELFQEISELLNK